MFVIEKTYRVIDFDQLKDHPIIIKLDVGASTYYSEIASMQTLDNLLMNGHITIVDYLERIPDDYVPDRRGLLDKKKREMEQAQQMQAMQMGMMPPQPEQGGGDQGPNADLQQKEDVHGGGGYSTLQRKINQG